MLRRTVVEKSFSVYSVSHYTIYTLHTIPFIPYVYFNLIHDLMTCKHWKSIFTGILDNNSYGYKWLKVGLSPSFHQLKIFN